jgi:hypothetical protein
MTIERMEDKSIRIKSRLTANTNDWEETAWQWIARSMGNPVNADPMEQVALHTPLRIIRRLQGQRLKMEALLFGQAGFLTGPFREVYPNQLQSEYKHLCLQYNLTPIAAVNWKFGRMRPSHFPTLRLSQLAELLSTDSRIFSLILTGHYTTWLKRLDIKAADYWMEHVHFKAASKKHGNQLGLSTKHSIIVNAFIPLLVLYGRETDQEDFISQALNMLERIPKENNKIIRNWEVHGMDLQHAGHSQGFLHLHQAYCKHKRCLDCHLGYSILGKVKYI